MYLVVSKWQPKPGQDEAFRSRGQAARNALRKVPGVTFIEAFWGEQGPMVVMGYESEERYRAIVHEPGGVFEQIAAAQALDDVAEWVWSERGECMVD